MDEITISGNIRFEKDKSEKDGGSYIICAKDSNHGWHIPTYYINPKDLRTMADHLEQQRTTHPKYKIINNE